MYAGQWYEVETELKLNTVYTGSNTYDPDGALRSWVDGRLVYESTGMVFRTLPAYDPGYVYGQIRPARELGVKELWLNWFHGGQSENTYPRTMFYSNVAWGTSRIGKMKTAATPIVYISAFPTSIAYNGNTTITWSSTNATSCSTPWGSTATGGSYTTPILTGSVNYRVNCSGASGSVNVSVGTAPSNLSINPTLTNIPVNTAKMLGQYTSTQLSECSLSPIGINSYSKFTYDSTNHQMLMWGGGHATTLRDDVDVLNLNSLNW